MKERILDILKDKERSIHELQHVLDLNNSEGFTVLLKALNQLEDEGKIVRNDKNEYLLIENSNYIVGVLKEVLVLSLLMKKVMIFLFLQEI